MVPHRGLVLSLLMLMALGGVGGLHARNNVLLIVSDDLNRRISPLGDPDAITPNLDRLAARSVLFRNAVCQNPLCGPSRASFLYGLYPWDIGIKKGGSKAIKPSKMLPNRLMVHEYFREQGYWTGSYGKVEHSLNPWRWDASSPHRTTEFPASSVVSSRTFGSYSNINGNAEFTVYVEAPELFADGLTTTDAIAAIGDRVIDGKPFFIAVGLQNPHTPWRVPDVISSQYDPATFTLPGDPAGSFALWPSWTFPNGKNDPRPVMDDSTKRELLHAYYSAVTLMDYQVGRILDTLDTHNLWDNTVVMFMSDNGFNLMEHRIMYTKKRITRESISVPIMIAAPGLSSNMECAQQVGLTDVYPTLVDLAGLAPYPKYLAGRSIAPLVVDPTSSWSHIQVSNTAGTGASNTWITARIAQWGPWKLVERDIGNSNPTRWIINHNMDPFEYFPRAAEVGAYGIDAVTYQSLVDSVADELPHQTKIYFQGIPPSAPPIDRDGDGLTGEQEIDLRFLSIRPFLNDAEQVLSSGVEIAQESRDLTTITLSTKLRHPVDGSLFDPDHCYPLKFEFSTDLRNWAPLSSPLELMNGSVGVRFTVDQPELRHFVRASMP